ncbi:MAG: MBG domain-containing protein, partial [Bacteroidales bacterium]|nr:MBG domain-containing protein [Bacteroidales bacterium]
EIIFTIENTGVDDLLLIGDPKIEISGADASAFIINQSSVVSPLSQGISTIFTIVFTPTSTDLHTAEISISNNDTDENPYNFTIFGSGGKLPQTIVGFGAITEKTYGDPSFVVSATASSGLNVIFTSSDENVATCGGVNGSTITIVNAGTCQIIANQAGDEIYLPANEVSQTLVVNVKPIDIIVDPGQSKTYGDADPELTFTVVPSLVNGDSYTGNLTRIEGEEIGLYEILQGDLSVGSNYELTFYFDNFEVTAKTITVTVNSGQSKIYGESNPVYTYSVSPALVEGDSFSGVLTRESGEDFGFYEILQGSLDLNSNYDLIFVSDDFEIIKKTITVTVTADQSKIYGLSDPVLNYTFSPGLVLGDSFSGELIREEGEDVGLYEIYQGTLQLGPNYNLQFVGNYFEIFNKVITVTPMPNQYKMYGQSDPVISYSYYPELLEEDEFSGELSRLAGEDVGYYEIELGSLNLGPNYTISFNPDVFEIKVQTIIVTVDEEQMKEYGEDDPDQFTYTVIGDLAIGDFLTGHLIRESGEDVGNYPILQGSLALNSNYNLVFMGENFEITAKQITVIADPNQSKIFGDDDPPVFTYTVEGNLLPGNEFTGALTRNMGESVGTYQIQIGNLSVNTNYDIVYIADYFHITPKEITVIADESQSKIFGEQDPELTYSVIGELTPGNYFSGQLSREPGEDVGFYEIQQGSLTVTYNYSINFISADFEIMKANPQIVWENPADIYFGTALSDVQLNATANIEGTFEYNPDNGTVLEIGNNQELQVIFMPEDNINYTNAEAIVYINVLLGSNSYEYNITQNIYPNPTTGLLYIDYSDCKIEELTVNDITGKVLVKADYFSDEIKMDLSILPAGTYIIVIKTNRGVITEKLIKW